MLETIEAFKTLPESIDKKWAVKELREFLVYVETFVVDDGRSYSKTHQKAFSEWYEYLHKKLKEYDFVNGKPEENTWEKRPKAFFWWCVCTTDPHYYRPFYDHHCSSKELKEQMVNIISDAISNITRKTLKDWLPYDYKGGTVDPRIEKHLQDEVVMEYGGMNEPERVWVGKHKNVYAWCTLKTGYAVGWNESPSRGWAFVITPLEGKKK